MRWMIESSMRLRHLIVILAVLLLIYGFVQLRQMPVDVYPEVAPPHVEVQTEAIGLSAEEVEAFVTVPLEADMLNGVAWLDQIYSESVAGLSSILLIFEPGTDPITARQMVQERLNRVGDLPNVSQLPVMIQPLSSSNRVMLVGLASEELSLIELGVLSRWTIKPRLLGVPGVANVAVWGQRERQLQVQVDPAKLQENGLSLRQIIETTGNALWVSPLSYLEASSPGTAGWIDTPNQRLSIRHLLPISTPEDLAQVAVVGTDGLLIGDVATVVEDHQPLIGDAALAEGPGLILVVEKFPNAHTLEVTQDLEKALADLQLGLPGVEVDTNLFRPANYIETAVDNVSVLVIIGLVLVAVILLAFYFNARTALVSLMALILSLIGSGVVLFLGGATFNIMMWVGLIMALAVVIDDAIVDVDNINKRLRQQEGIQGDESRIRTILEAMLEVRSPLGFGLLIVLLLTVPIFFLPGLTGIFFRPLILTYTLTIITSLIVALVVTPALSISLLSNGAPDRPSPISQRVQSGYRRLLARTIQSAPLALVVAAVCIVIGLSLLPFLDVSLLPSLKQDNLLIEIEAVPGTSGPAMNRIAMQASNELRAIPGVLNVGAHVGRAITGDAIVGINSGTLWLSLDPKADYEATVTAVQEVISGYPGLTHKVQTYQPERIEEVLTSAEDNITVRVFGHELDILGQKAQEVAATITGIEGVVEAQPILYEEEPQVEIIVDLAAAEQYGVKPGDVRRQATTLLSGIHVGSLFEEQKVFDVIVWGVPELRNDLTGIRELLIQTPSGEQVALGEVASVEIVPAAAVIKRDSVSRYMDVIATINGRSFEAVTADIESRLASIDIPFEYHIEVLNDSQAVQTNRQRLGLIVLTVLLGIYLLMQAAFSSWRLSFLILITLPMALAGSVLAVVLSGGMLSIGALFGFLAILALAVRNSMVMIHHLQNLAQTENVPVTGELVLRGAEERARPILITAMATIVAFLPLLLAGNIAGNEMVWPMAAVIVGGLITSTLLNLFVVPALYLRWPGTALEPTHLPASIQPTPEVA